ncbi:hypothetical protein BIW11_12144 [Tropilaelaps mercedesae]|uniref:Uncharacterized protein n=1 Tax=Tropilaelaps mercedesae TaxID=418985 RepID=A0A1V9X7T4_9ACAR|nr:hypothetical protein BIW11_12144 [Tropilaelaps mercedesae]
MEGNRERGQSRGSGGLRRACEQEKAACPRAKWPLPSLQLNDNIKARSTCYEETEFANHARLETSDGGPYVFEPQIHTHV